MKVKSLMFKFPAAGVVNKRYYLPRDPEIINARTRGIQIPVGNELASNYNIGNLTVPLTTTQLKNMFLTLVDVDYKEVYKDLAPYTLTVANNNGIIRDFLDHHIETSQCYLTLTDATGITTNSYIIFDFYID